MYERGRKYSCAESGTKQTALNTLWIPSSFAALLWCARRGICRRRNSLRRPNQNVLPSSEVQEWSRDQRDPQCLCHRIPSEFGFRLLQRPRRMVNLAANDSPAPVSRVQTVAFGQEIFQSSAARGENLTNGVIPHCQQSGRRPAMHPLTLVVNPSIPFCATHSGSKIRQVKPRARNGNRQRVTRIETEKPHAGFSTARHVGANIQLRKSREPWQRRCSAQPYTGHAKWNYSEPCLPFKSVDLQLRGKKWAQERRINRPVREEQVVPALRHHPCAGGQKPRPMRDFLQDSVHARSQSFLDKLTF